MKLARVIYNDRTFLAEVSGEDSFHLYETTLEQYMHDKRLPQKVATASRSQVRLLPPLILQRNVMCVGLNYRDHAAESLKIPSKEFVLPSVPIIFTKATTSAAGPDQELPFPARALESLDWEVELGVVIGTRCKNITEQQAWDVVFGLTIVNDISARNQQKAGKQFFKGKSFDHSCPFGPWIVTKDEFSLPLDIQLRCFVDGEKKQDSSTAHMIFSVPQLIAHLSDGMTLLPGDLIATGTPGGVGFAREPQEFLHHGSSIRCEIEGIGVLENTIIEEQE